ncbi:MAG: outer membrane beta-barrel protein [Limisphaerales bacterium]
MKINNWTRALLATGVVGMGAVAQAEEGPAANVLTAVSGTQISGYVSTSAIWSPDDQPIGTSFTPAGDHDGFNLDVVDVTISKALDDSDWATGYTAEFWFGPDATGLGNNVGAGATGSDIAIKQANIQLRAPIGNGLDLTMGVFDTIIGYEVANSVDNWNYTRSYGFFNEPFQHNGLLASYRVCDEAAVNVGIANTANTTLTGRNAGGTSGSSSALTYMASLNVTLPDSLGPLAGSEWTFGAVDGDNVGVSAATDTTHIYAGGVMNTPLAGLQLGVAWDHLNVEGAVDVDTIALYTSYEVSKKLKVNTRLDYLDGGSAGVGGIGGGQELLGTTVTADYALWENVLTRAEVRWDHILDHGPAQSAALTPAGGTAGATDAWLFAVNVAYRF